VSKERWGRKRQQISFLKSEGKERYSDIREKGTKIKRKTRKVTEKKGNRKEKR